MKLVTWLATNKWGLPFEATRRDLIDGTIDELIEALSRQKKQSKTKNSKQNMNMFRNMARCKLQS